MNTWKWMKDYLGNKFYPYTHTDAVYVGNDEENLRNLTDELNQIKNKLDKNTDNTQADWNETNSDADAYIRNKPTSLPADGGNADTLDGKHAMDFIDKDHLSNANAHQELFDAKLNTESANILIKNLNHDPSAGIITVTRMDNTTFTIHIPKTLVFQSAIFDEEAKEIVITWSDNSQSRIPIEGLVDVYTGSIGDVIQISVSGDNIISANVKEGSIDRNLLSSDVQENLESMAEHLSNAQIHIPDGGDVGQIVGMTDNGIGWVASSATGGNGSLDDYVRKTEMNTALSTKVDQEDGKSLISNDEKAKLSSIPNIIFSDTIPASLDENTICFVYETEEGDS